MQTLGLADSTPRSESRLKSLFWPTITSSADVDYLGTQGYWVCTIVAVLTLLSLCTVGHPILGILFSVYFYLGGMGVREGSIYAALAVFLLYLINALAGGMSIFETSGIVRIFLVVILLSNVRATIISATWAPESQEAEPTTRLNTTWGDKFADQLPMWLWRKIRIVYYVYSLALFTFILLGWMIMIVRRMPH